MGLLGMVPSKPGNQTPEQKQAIITLANSLKTQVVVAPLQSIAPQDIVSSRNSINDWLKQNISPDFDLNTLAQVAGVIPVVGNIIALVDVVEGIINLVNNPNPAILDWVDLCINLIGVIPVPPGMNTARMTLRPMVMAARNAVSTGKTTLALAVESAIQASLNDVLAGQIQPFVDKATGQIDTLINGCSDYAMKISNDFSSGLINIANGQAVNPIAIANAQKDAQKSFSKVTTTSLIRDPKNTFDNLFKALTLSASAQVGQVANQVLQKILARLGAAGKAALLAVATKIKTFGAKAAQAIKAKAKVYLLKFIEILKSVLKRRPKGGAVKPNTTTQVKSVTPASPLESKSKVTKPKKDPNPCNCGGAVASKKSISFITGVESLTHLDADIFSTRGIFQTRSYASNLEGYDKSEFGARWLTPWTLKIFVEDDKFLFVDETGRIIHLPKLAENTTYLSVAENLYITNLGNNLVIEYKNKEQYLFEKYKDHYILKAIVKSDQSTILIGHEEGILHKIEFFYDKKLDCYIECIKNSNQKIEKLILNKDGKCLDIASYFYDQQGDLIQATTRDHANYHYSYHKHLLTRYTDLTNRAINLEWDGETYEARAFHEWADDGSQELSLVWLDDKRCTLVIDGEGNVTQYHYDIEGYNYRIVYPDELEEWFIRDSNSKITQHFTTTGEVYIYRYNDQGDLLESINPDGSSVEYKYENGNPVEIKNAEGAIWKNEYDDNDQLTKEIDPLQRETSYCYNAQGLPTSIIDAKGGLKSFKYDAQGNLLSYQDCSGKETKWGYDERGRVKFAENALKQKVEYFYSGSDTEQRTVIIKGVPLNALGQLEKIKHADGTEEHFVHDAEGRLLAHLDPNQQQTRYEYDESGLITVRTDALGHKLKYKWDQLGRLQRLINENGASYQFFYDVMGRLLKEIDFDGKETVYKYDDRTKQLTTSIEVASAYGQDLKDRVAQKDRIQQFVFDSMGRLEQRTAGYGYDSHEVEQQQIEEFAYDSNGQLVLARNADSAAHWFYDAVGNQIREHHQDLKTNKTAVWKHTYDELNVRIQTIRPDGQNIDWLTYGSGHVQSLILNGEDVVSFERDDLHRETTRHYANGISQEQKYDDIGRLTQQRIVNGHEFGYQSQTQQQNNAINKTQQLIQRLYQYDKTGQLTGIQDTRRGNINYKYDPVGRLLDATSKLGKEKFRFDPANNIIDPYNMASDKSSKQNTEEGHYGYNRLVNNVVKEYLEQQYQYDEFGQLIRQKTAQGDLHLEWDVFGRLIKSHNAEYTAEYRYDALGRRIQKRSKHHHTGAEQNVFYGWDGDTVAFESTEDYTKHYIYEKGSFIPLVQAVYQSSIELHQTLDWTDKPYSIYRDPIWKTIKKSKGFDDVWFYHCDHLGTPLEMTDHSGAIIWKAQYKAWGELVSAKQRFARAQDESYARSGKSEKAKSSFFENSEIISNNIRFQGQYFDEETGLHYNRYRYYSPYVGRFVSKDPIGLLGGSNIYQYAPNPIEWIDPYGLQATKNTCKVSFGHKITRYVSKAEALAIKANNGLVPIIGSNGKPSAKAIWVNDGSDFNPGKEKTRVVITVTEKGRAILNKNVVNDEMLSGESTHPDGIMVKTNEPGAKGIGRNVVPEFNKEIENICIQTKGSDGKWK
ncbi:RHS repeat-associated core domain-containing protein [Acinetobacter bereziniae]|uniref:RHS repeat-associated core domain-containing protein n=1 Tax=Acinetobacter bereziniae TaxID=106648 RepID=UPI001FB9955E|nr:RHS repeat-associated core domain-containing protein [Acinetobacter bereziniae]